MCDLYHQLQPTTISTEIKTVMATSRATNRSLEFSTTRIYNNADLGRNNSNCGVLWCYLL